MWSAYLPNSQKCKRGSIDMSSKSTNREKVVGRATVADIGYIDCCLSHGDQIHCTRTVHALYCIKQQLQKYMEVLRIRIRLHVINFLFSSQLFNNDPTNFLFFNSVRRQKCLCRILQFNYQQLKSRPALDLICNKHALD